MPNITNRKRRPVKRVTRRTLKRFYQIVGVDGARAMFQSLEETGGGVTAAMHARRPFIDRYVEVYGEEKDTRKNFYKRRKRGGRADV